MVSVRRIRVLECIRQGQVGGGESHLLSLIENLDLSVFEPVVLSFTEGPMVDTLRQNGIECHVINTEKAFDFTKWAKVKDLLKSRQIDVVHAHGTRANSNIIWAARSLDIPVIYTVHGWSFHQDQSAMIRQLRISGERFLTSRSRVNISVSLSNKLTGVKHLKSFKSVVIKNGINSDKFSPHNTFKNLRNELSISERKIILLFVARFTLQKQPMLLIEAFRAALADYPQLHLLMVGDGELKLKAVQLAQAYDLNENVTFLPFRSDIPELLASSDIFVLPSLWEGLPIALLEAMSMGKAVIATDVDGTREVINHLNNGILVKAGDIEQLVKAILQLANDYSLRKRLQKGAQHTIKDDYNASTMTKKVESVYLSVVAGKSNTEFTHHGI